MRKFGVEIEFIGDLQAAIDSIQAAGITVQDSRHTHNTGIAPTHWAVKRDGSVSRGGELASIPLDFDDPEQRGQVDTVITALQNSGATIDGSCGIHVHIEANNEDGTPFTGRQIGAVVRFVYKFEDAIYRIASSGWQSLRPGARTYAKPIPEDIAKAIMKAKTVQDVQNVWDGNIRQNRYGFRGQYLDRYVALNLRSYWLRNTIEFRHFNASLNPTRVQTYIALCMAIMDDARKGHARQTKTNYPIGSMANGTVSEQALMLRLQQVLTQEDKDTHRLMDKQDWKNLRRLCWKGSVPQTNIW